MGMERIRNWPYPYIQETNENRELVTYLQMLHNELQQESSSRIRDFEDFIFSAGEVTTLTANALYIYDTDKSDLLRLYWGEDDDATRQMQFKVNSGDRIMNLSQNLIVAGDGSLTLTADGANRALTVEAASKIDQDLTADAEVEFKVITFNAEYPNGNSGATKTIDWGNGQKQKVTLTANCTFTFTAPNGPGNFTLRLIQDAGGTNTATWPATVKWPGGTAPTITAAGNAVDICTFYFNGTSYYGDFAQNYS